MINKFLKQLDYKADEFVLNDICRLTKELDLSSLNADNRNDKFDKLAKIYCMIEEHCFLLTRFKQLRDSFYHRECQLLEAFIKYLIEQYQFPCSFDELIIRNRDAKICIIDDQIWELEVADIPSSDSKDVPEPSKKENHKKIENEGFDLDFEDF